MTFTVLMDIPLRPDATEVDEAFLHDLPGTRSFPGNELTEVIADEDRHGTLTLLTRWATREAYDDYVAWRRSPDGVTRLAEIAADTPVVRRFSPHLAFPQP